MANNNNNNWKRIGGFSRTGTQNYVRTNDAAMGGTTFGSTDVSNNVGNTILRIGNNAGVVYINGDIDMSGGVNVVVPINRIRNVRDPVADQDVATKFYVDKTVDAVIMSSVDGVITGPTGREGPPGIGIAGTNGSDGPTGHTGCTGPLGATGSSFGVKGPTGERGVPGSTGANGAAGATGPIGPVGEKGEQGTQGTQGIQGSNGTILWLNPDGDSPTNQLITDSYLLSKVPINASIRTVGPISVSATYGNNNKIIPASRFFNTAIEVSTLAVIPSGVWVLNLYANVPSTSDANQVALYAAVFMISGTTNQPSPDSLVIETKDGGDAGYYPPRAAYLPDHVKYIGKSWASTENVLTSNTDTANKGVPIDGTSRKLYKLEIPVEFITLKDASGNRENVYVQLQIYIRNTKDANQTANVSLYFQTDATTNETTYSYLQTTFGAVGIQGIPGTTGSTGAKGEIGLIGPAGPAGATGSVGPTGIAGPVGPRGSQGPTGVTGPGGSSNSYGVQYAVQYRGNQSTGDTDNSGNFRGDTNFRYIPTGYINRLTDASAGSVVLNDLACNSIHSPVYVQDTSIVVGTGTTRPRTYIRGGELVNSGGSAEQSNYVVLASGTDSTNGSNSKTAVSVNDITNGIKMIHNYGTKKVTFQVHDENKASGTVGLQFDLNGSAVLGNVSAAQDQFCIVNSSGAAGMGGITAAQLSSSTYTALNRMLHVRGNVMVGSDPGGVNAASNAMVLLNKSTTTPSTPMSGYPGVYHRQIASGEVNGLGGSTNSIATAGEGLGFISPNFITFQTGSSLQNNSIVINQAGVVSVTGRTNLNGAVSVNKNFATVETHDNLAPIMDISGTLSVTTGAPDFTDVPRIKLISRGVAANSAIPSTTTTSTSNEIRGVSSNSSTSGFLRLSAQTPAHSCIDLIGLNTSTSAYNNAVRISTGGTERMIVNGSGNVGIGTNAPTVRLDVAGAANVSTYLSVGSGGATTSNIPDKFYVRTGGSNWRYYIPLLVANSTTNIMIWGGPDSQWYIIGGNEIAQQYSYFAAYWLNANQAVVGTSFSVESFAILSGFTTPSTRGIFTFTATAVSNGIVTAYKATLSLGGYGEQQLTPQQDGIDAGVARRSLSNRTLITGGSVETGYVHVTGSAKVSTILSAQTGIILGDNTRSAMESFDGSTISGSLLNMYDGTKPRMEFRHPNNRFAIGCVDTEAFIWSHNAKPIAFGTSDNRRMTITNTGNVGIGIEAATSLLHVAGAAKITGNLDMSSSGKIVNLVNPTAAQDAATKTYVDGRFINASITNNLSVSGVVEITASSATATALTTTGRIGVNTAAPTAALDVNDIARVRYSLWVNSKIYVGTTGLDVATGCEIGYESTNTFALWNYRETPMRFGTSNYERMRILADGKVGIGTTAPNALLDVNGISICRSWMSINSTSTPSFPLHVFSSFQGQLNTNGPTQMGVNTSFLQAGSSIRNISICAQDGDVAALNFAAYSDKRIKKNIHPLQPNKCVEMIRDLSPVSYNYIDYITNSTCSMYGFIAQDVKKHIPDAISYKTDYIPNLYSQVKLSKYSDESTNTDTAALWKVTLITSYTESGVFTFCPNKDNSGNEYVSADGSPLSDSLGNQKFKIKFITYDSSGGKNEIICYTHKLLNDTEFLIDTRSINNESSSDTTNKYSFEEKEYFLYGQEVPDFHILTYDYLWSVFSASLKEVDRQQQADKACIAELENQVSNLEATVASQQSLINDILERLKKLEA